MSDVEMVAAISTANSRSQVNTAIGIKVLKMANEQQKSVATLIDAAVQASQQIASGQDLEVIG